MDSSTRIEAFVAPKTFLALQQDAVPILRDVKIINEGEELFRDIELAVEFSPVFFRLDQGIQYQMSNYPSPPGGKTC